MVKAKTDGKIGRLETAFYVFVIVFMLACGFAIGVKTYQILKEQVLILPEPVQSILLEPIAPDGDKMGIVTEDSSYVDAGNTALTIPDSLWETSIYSLNIDTSWLRLGPFDPTPTISIWGHNDNHLDLDVGPDSIRVSGDLAPDSAASIFLQYVCEMYATARDSLKKYQKGELVMSERKYTVKEIAALRRVCKNLWLYDAPWPVNGRGEPYRQEDMDRASEDMVRTYMMAGLTADDIIKEYED